MRRWLRRLRGVLGTGAIWGVPGAVVGVIGGLLVSIFGGAPLADSLITGGTTVGATFFLLGSGSAAALALAERRPTVDELSTRRAAVWGAVAGAVLPIIALLLTLGPTIIGQLGDPQLLLAVLSGVGSYGALGAALAASTVALAKHAPRELDAGGDPEIPELLGAAPDA